MNDSLKGLQVLFRFYLAACQNASAGAAEFTDFNPLKPGIGFNQFRKER